MSYVPLDNIVTPEQKANLTKLLHHMRTVTEAKWFDMEAYALAAHGEVSCPIELEELHLCGTVCCLAGHGPYAGIPGQPGESWPAYTSRVFGAASFVEIDSHEGFLFVWLFSGEWVLTDNTLAGAIRRLEIALTKGVPLNANRQAFGYATIEYK